MELCNLVTGRGFIGFQDDNRLIGLLRQGHQPPAVREIFKIHADHPGLRVRHEIGQVIAFVQIQLVADAD